MNLPNELISQWAKLANNNDSKKTKTETTVYGTTVEENGTMYVKLDGSDLLTPTISTADTKSGERVMVMVKNHTAVITGNVSSPAARTADVQDAASSAESAAGKATNLEQEVATIKNTLSTQANDIDNLQRSLKTINDTVTTHGKTLTKHTEEIELINETLTTIQEEIETIKETLTKLEEQIESL